MNQRRLKQRFAAASVIGNSNHAEGFVHPSGTGFVDVNGMQPQKFMSTNSPAVFNKTFY